jgi:hypothetical protein
LTSFGLAALGGGKYSIDNAADIPHMYGGYGLLISLLGVLGAAGLLLTCWTPPKKVSDSTSS